MAWLEIRNLRKEYPLEKKTTIALDDFSLSVEKGDFVGIVGRSGSGKTTLLRLLSGLLKRTSGEIVYRDGEEAKIGMVFQEPRLMPWLTVEKNILFAYLKDKKKRLPHKQSEALLDLLGLGEYKNAYPSQLSGGMAQRVALGRALCYEPELILMDEPLGALDYFTRKALQDEILKLHFLQKKTILFVTHDVEEALTLSRRIVVLEGGRLIREIPVDMPYPRRQSDPKFAKTLDLILSLIVGG
ncbi:ABC transporter ATP-binding protein [Synergistaceae bacterium OttesenSCG-928-I11]|nr:ABC transporter ATP-binding protein [Synergistaceae bacterium OttesenSCG-928-I11]